MKYQEIILLGETVNLIRKKYSSTNQNMLEAIDQHGEVIFTLTINLKNHEIDNDYIAIKDYGETKGAVDELVALKIIEKPEKTIKINDVNVLICKFTKAERTRVNEEIINSPEFISLKQMAEEYIDSLEKNDGYVDDDLKHYIFEGVMELFYGKKIWDYINRLMK